jgi:multidrug efflux pump subunit AcrA (membrane-fusion protein)
MVVGKDDRAHQTAVELGIQGGDNVQVTKGVNAGDTVVATGAYGLPDNTRVRAAPPAPATGETKASAAEKD